MSLCVPNKKSLKSYKKSKTEEEINLYNGKLGIKKVLAR